VFTLWSGIGYVLVSPFHRFKYLFALLFTGKIMMDDFCVTVCGFSNYFQLFFFDHACENLNVFEEIEMSK
jgi:hypothetical protein